MSPRVPISLIVVVVVVAACGVASSSVPEDGEPRALGALDDGLKQNGNETTLVGGIPGFSFNLDKFERSANCSKLKPSSNQPTPNVNALIRKCCPDGEFFNADFECVTGRHPLNVKNISAVFYGDSQCIDQVGKPLQLQHRYDDVCEERNRTSYLYGNGPDDELFVIQNGSLLVITTNHNEKLQFEVFNTYCVEMIQENGKFIPLAKVCDDQRDPVVLWFKSPAIYVGLVLTTIVLVITCLVYTKVPQLNDIFGLLVVAHSGTFNIGMIAMCLAVLGSDCEVSKDSGNIVVQSVAHIFIASSTFAFSLMCAYNYTSVAYYLPNGKNAKLKPSHVRIAAIFLGALFVVTILSLYRSSRDAIVFQIIMWVYYVAIVIMLILTKFALQRLIFNCMKGEYHGPPKIGWAHSIVAPRNENSSSTIESLPTIADREGRESESSSIDGKDLRCVHSVLTLCMIEAVFTGLSWAMYYLCWVSTQTNRDVDCDFYRLRAAYAVIFQGLLIGVLYLGLRSRWTIIVRHLRSLRKKSVAVPVPRQRNSLEQPMVSDPLLPPAAIGPVMGPSAGPSTSSPSSRPPIGFIVATETANIGFRN